MPAIPAKSSRGEVAELARPFLCRGLQLQIEDSGGRRFFYQPVFASIEPVSADCRPHRLVAEDPPPWRFAPSARSHHQRNQVLFPRMSKCGKRCFAPAGQQRIPFRRRRLHGARQPCIEGAGPLPGLRPKIRAQVMKAHPAPHDQHALIAQRSQRAPGCEMQSWIERRGHRKRHHWNPCLGKCNLQRNKNSVVEAAA